MVENLIIKKEKKMYMGGKINTIFILTYEHVFPVEVWKWTVITISSTHISHCFHKYF